MPPATSSLKAWMDNHATFKKWPDEQRVTVTATLEAEDFQELSELVYLEEAHITAVVAGLSDRRARQFQEAIAALKQGAGSGAGADGVVSSSDGGAGARAGSEASPSIAVNGGDQSFDPTNNNDITVRGGDVKQDVHVHVHQPPVPAMPIQPGAGVVSPAAALVTL